MENGVSTQAGQLLFSGQFEQIKIEDLATSPEFGKSQTTDVLLTTGVTQFGSCGGMASF